jgi:hypothetical protein
MQQILELLHHKPFSQMKLSQDNVVPTKGASLADFEG